MTFPIGTSAVGLAAFDRPGDQGCSHDMSQVKAGQHGENLLPSGKERVSGYGFVRIGNLISSIHDKIIPWICKEVHTHGIRTECILPGFQEICQFKEILDTAWVEIAIAIDI